MEVVFEIILQFFFEILLQLFFEFLAELGFRSLKRVVRKTRGPIFSMVGFVLLGGLAGWISLWLFPNYAIGDPMLRDINLMVTPIAAGLVMMLIGKMRSKRGEELVRIERFGFAFAFAAAMALVRYIWAA